MGICQFFIQYDKSPTSKVYASVLIHDSTTATNKQARGHSTKGGCSSIEL